jgi:Type I restriction modification DNA specificity domain
MTSASEQFPPQDWRKRQLYDLCYVVGGGTPSRSQPKYWNGDIPWASVKDFSDEAVFLHDTKEHITQEGLESSASTLVQATTYRGVRRALSGPSSRRDYECPKTQPSSATLVRHGIGYDCGLPALRATLDHARRL